jgi:hypothetical protein
LGGGGGRLQTPTLPTSCPVISISSGLLSSMWLESDLQVSPMGSSKPLPVSYRHVAQISYTPAITLLPQW